MVDDKFVGQLVNTGWNHQPQEWLHAAIINKKELIREYQNNAILD